MRVKFVAVAGAFAMLVSSTGAIAASPVNQRPSQLKVSQRAGAHLEEASEVSPQLLALLIALFGVAGFAIARAIDNSASPA